jgi:hypothetical protein
MRFYNWRLVAGAGATAYKLSDGLAHCCSLIKDQLLNTIQAAIWQRNKLYSSLKYKARNLEVLRYIPFNPSAGF